MVDLIELDMVHFDVILGMDWLHACYASVNSRNRFVKFHFPNESVSEWKNIYAVLEIVLFCTLRQESLFLRGASIT